MTGFGLLRGDGVSGAAAIIQRMSGTEVPPGIAADTVDALVDSVREMIKAEDVREQGFTVRAGGLAGSLGSPFRSQSPSPRSAWARLFHALGRFLPRQRSPSPS
jgi:hypothetical protein